MPTRPLASPSIFILKLPKAELHLHLEGSVTPVTLAELSRRHPTPLPAENNRYRPDPSCGDELDEAAVRKLYNYKDFSGFLLAFKAVTERMRTAADYELVTYELMRQLRAQNVLHAEVYVSVGVVHWRGQEFAPLFAGLERGRERGTRDFGISLLWIFDAVRHFGVEEAQRVVELAVELRKQQIATSGESSIVAIGIGGDERRAPARNFAAVYQHATQHGLRLTAHAGETAGPDSIWGALNIKAERLGHGLHALEDPELMEHLVETQVAVEICISSNVATGCCARIEDHPVKKLFDAGVMITLNTDDPAMFHTSLTREYQLAQEVFGFSDEHLREIARNSFEASFLPAEKKVEFLKLSDS